MKLKNFAVYAKNFEKGQKIKDQVKEQGFSYSEESPDFIITVGGDGTYLEAERKMPGVPKLLVRDSLICFKCNNEPLKEMLNMIQSGKSCVEEILKLKATYSQGELLAVNDIVLRNQNLIHAIRFQLSCGGEEIDNNIIGDGVVVATPFGATGYYKAVTQSTFEEGIGVAFNNPTEAKKPLLLEEDKEVTIEMTRGIADLAADNNPNIVTLKEGESVKISKSSQIGRLISHHKSI